MNEVQNFANFHTCYLPYGLKFFHKGHPKHKLNYSWPEWRGQTPWDEMQNYVEKDEYQLPMTPSMSENFVLARFHKDRVIN